MLCKRFDQFFNWNVTVLKQFRRNPNISSVGITIAF